VCPKNEKMVFFLLKYRGHFNGEGSKNVNKQKPWSPIGVKNGLFIRRKYQLLHWYQVVYLISKVSQSVRLCLILSDKILLFPFETLSRVLLEDVAHAVVVAGALREHLRHGVHLPAVPKIGANALEKRQKGADQQLSTSEISFLTLAQFFKQKLT
jgi:hypothetical protein